MRHHVVREVLKDGHVDIKYMPTEDMSADVLTKGLSKEKHRRCLELLGMKSAGSYSNGTPFGEF